VHLTTKDGSIGPPTRTYPLQTESWLVKTYCGVRGSSSQE